MKTPLLSQFQHKLTTRRRLTVGFYIAFVAIISFQLLYWGRLQANKVIVSQAKAEAALEYEIASALSSLTPITTIVPAQTSGFGPGVLSNIESTTAFISTKDTKRSLLPIYSNLSYRNKSAFNTIHKSSRSSAEQTRNQLNELHDTLSASLKFIEYNPMADLMTFSLNDATVDSKERLDRTEAGLISTSDALSAINTPTSKAIATDINALLPALQDLRTNGDIKAWSEKVLMVQRQTINKLKEARTSIIEEEAKNHQNNAKAFLNLVN